MNWTLEVVLVPVSDVDRAKEFYAGKLGFAVDHDTSPNEDFRIVQLTPPGSGCSVVISKGLTQMQPGSIEGLQLVVNDLHQARKELVDRGVEVSEVAVRRPPGLDAPGRSYFAQATFSDPDGNGWILQEVTSRLPGRTWDS